MLTNQHVPPDVHECVSANEVLQRRRQMNCTTTVFTNSLGYAQRRNFASLPFTWYRFEKRLDLARFPTALLYRVFGWIPTTLQNVHVAIPGNGRYLHHDIGAKRLLMKC